MKCLELTPLFQLQKAQQKANNTESNAEMKHNQCASVPTWHKHRRAANKLQKNFADIIASRKGQRAEIFITENDWFTFGNNIGQRFRKFHVVAETSTSRFSDTWVNNLSEIMIGLVGMVASDSIMMLCLTSSGSNDSQKIKVAPYS